jgi:hypothetical protein
MRVRNSSPEIFKFDEVPACPSVPMGSAFFVGFSLRWGDKFPFSRRGKTAEVPELPGVLVYGATKVEARNKAAVLALRVIADRIEAGELRAVG